MSDRKGKLRVKPPTIGDLVMARDNFHGAGCGNGIVVDKRGIEVMVMSSDSAMLWVMRTQVDVISEGR